MGKVCLANSLQTPISANLRGWGRGILFLFSFSKNEYSPRVPPPSFLLLPSYSFLPIPLESSLLNHI